MTCIQVTLSIGAFLFGYASSTRQNIYLVPWPFLLISNFPILYDQDPQIHSFDKTQFGEGNLGAHGFASFFYSHRCNSICRLLELKEFPVYKASPCSVQMSDSDSTTSKNQVCEQPRSISIDFFLLYQLQTNLACSSALRIR